MISLKIISFTKISDQVKKWRKESKSLVFTNGCFDLLHAGHVKYLQKAALLGDILILGLNSDSSVKKIKGSSRPIISQEDRALLLSALEIVDCIVVFEDETPLSLIEIVKPDILVKGGDYSAVDIVGYKTVTSSGGHVEVIDFVEGYSTSGILKSIMVKI